MVQQLQERPYYLYLYLDALFDKDRQLAADYADRQVGISTPGLRVLAYSLLKDGVVR